jgi:hypothetical protein
MLGVVAVVLHT